MKRLIFTILVSLFSLTLSGQTKNNPDNIYSQALEKFTAYLDSNYQMNESVLSFIHVESVSSFLPHQCFNHEILIQNMEEQLALIKHNKKVILLLITPMKFDGKEFVIGFLSYNYSEQMKNVSAVWECHFRFDCETSMFNFLYLKGGGI
jgi:hypothetical protein